MLAVLESQQEVAAILIPPLLKLRLSSLLIKLLAFEMCKLKEDRTPERYSRFPSNYLILEFVGAIHSVPLWDVVMLNLLYPSWELLIIQRMWKVFFDLL